MDPSPPARLAPIRTKFALPCAFAALITFCTLATAQVARSAEPPVARAVFVTPAGDRAAARAAVVAAGGIPERWVGGRLKAALAAGALRGPAPLARGRGRRDRRDVLGRRDHLAGRRPERRGRRCSARGSDGSGVTIVVLDQAFGAASRLNALAGSELPPLERQHRLSFDADLRARRARLQRQQLAPRRVRDARSSTTWRRARPTGSSTTTRPTSSAWPSTTSRTCSNRTSSSTRTRSCSGRFDGSGWFAQKVDAAAAAGVLWVNSAGNYRTRHWEGAVERRRRRRQPRRAGRRQRLPRRAGGDQPPRLRPLVGGRHRRSRRATTASRSTPTRR